MQIKRPFILDIWEANTVTDWNVADGYFICASWNLQMEEDKNFGISWNGAGQAKKPRGAYFSVNMNLSTADQAKAFVAIINKNGGLKPGDKLAADCEVGQLSISAIIDFIWNVEQLTGIRPMLYSRANLLNALNFGKLNAGQLAYVKSVDLWSAGYPSNPDLYSTPPSGYVPDPSAYGPVKIWQYLGDVVPSDVGLSGVSGGIDLNWIDSTFFTQWQGETSAQQPAPTPQPVPAPIPAPLPEPTPAPTGTNIGSQIHHEDSGSVGSPYDVPMTTPPEVQTIRYGILKTFIVQNQLIKEGKYTPATVPIQDRPIPSNPPFPQDRGGKGQSIPIGKLPKLQNYIKKINNAAGAHYALDTVGAMWINSPGQGESINCEHNIVSWDSANDKNGCHNLRAFMDDEDFDAYLDSNGNPTVTWLTRPDLFFKAIAYNKDAHFINVVNDVDCFIPACATKFKGGTGQLWLDANEIEEFPVLPVEVEILPNAQSGHLNIHSTFNFDPSTVTGQYASGDKVTIYAYRPIGASVFGQTDKGWICLLQSTKPGERNLLTSWQIETDGVIPPA